MPKRFETEYRKANDQLHAPQKALDTICEQTAAKPRHLHWTRYACAAAAAVIMLGGGLGIFLRGTGSASKSAVPAMMAVAAGAPMEEAVQEESVSYDMAESTAVTMALPKRQQEDAFVSPADYEELYSLLTAINGDSIAKDESDSGSAVPATSEPNAGGGEFAATDTAVAAPSNYSTTNVQVEGIDEADIIKTDGTNIYYLANGTLYVVSAKGTDSAILSKTVISMKDGGAYFTNPIDIFLTGKTVTVLMNASAMVWDAATGSGTSVYELVYDVSNPAAPVLTGYYGQSGSYSDSRMMDGTIYLVTNQYLWNAMDSSNPGSFCPILYRGTESSIMPASDILVNTRSSQTSYSVISCLSPESPESSPAAQAILGATGTVYMNREHLLLASTEYHSEQTDIAPGEDGRNLCTSTYYYDTSLVLFDIADGILTRKAAAVVDGNLSDQYAIDEYEGVFRIVTSVSRNICRIYTDGIDTYEWDDESYNALFTLDGELQPIGSITNLAPGEYVQSVRFSGPICYITTFRTIDPLFSIDLQDPANPTVLGALKIEGFSDYMHPYTENRLLGIGYDMDTTTYWQQVVKLVMFDTTDKTNVTALHTKKVDDASWTLVSTTPQAILVDASKDIIAFPTEDGYYVYGYSDTSGFVKKAFIPADENSYSSALRGLYIGDLFYVFNGNTVSVLSLGSYQTLATLPLEN